MLTPFMGLQFGIIMAFSRPVKAYFISPATHVYRTTVGDPIKVVQIWTLIVITTKRSMKYKDAVYI